MITLFNTRKEEVIAPVFLGNVVFNTLSDRYICWAELDEGWLYKLAL